MLRIMRGTPDLGHRLLVSFGLREDPELVACWEREGVDQAVSVLSWIPLLLLAAGFIYAVDHLALVRLLVGTATTFALLKRLLSKVAR